MRDYKELKVIDPGELLDKIVTFRASFVSSNAGMINFLVYHEGKMYSLVNPCSMYEQYEIDSLEQMKGDKIRIVQYENTSEEYQNLKVFDRAIESLISWSEAVSEMNISNSEKISKLKYVSSTLREIFNYISDVVDGMSNTCDKIKDVPKYEEVIRRAEESSLLSVRLVTRIVGAVDNLNDLIKNMEN